MTTLAPPSRWPGISPSGTLILPLPKRVWAPPSRPVEVEGTRFSPKAELHITLLSRDKVQALYACKRLDRVGVRRLLKETFDELRWEYTRTHEWLVLERESVGKGRVASIVELIRLPALARFINQVAGAAEVSVAVGPPHVTLYTYGEPTGIGVESTAALRALTRREIRPENVRPV